MRWERPPRLFWASTTATVRPWRARLRACGGEEREGRTEYGAAAQVKGEREGASTAGASANSCLSQGVPAAAARVPPACAQAQQYTGAAPSTANLTGSPGGAPARKTHRSQASKAAAHNHHVNLNLLAFDVGRQVAAVRVVCRGVWRDRRPAGSVSGTLGRLSQAGMPAVTGAAIGALQAARLLSGRLSSDSPAVEWRSAESANNSRAAAAATAW